MFSRRYVICGVCAVLCWYAAASSAPCADEPPLRVGAAATNLKADGTMVLGGMLSARYSDEQEGELRAVAVVVQNPGTSTVAIVGCDVLWIPRWIVEAATAEIEQATGIPPSHVLINATHTHYAPSTAPAHDFGVSLRFCEELRRGIVQAVCEAHSRLEEAQLYFHLGEEKTVGANSRLKLPDGNITWINPLREAGQNIVPTGPFDPQLPVIDFRTAQGQTRALIYNHSTHTLGTRCGRDVRSPSFYGLAAQELEGELGGVVCFLEGASGSTHNIYQVPVPEAIERMKRAIREARAQAQPMRVGRVAALRRPFTFRVRSFDEQLEDAKVARYTSAYLGEHGEYVRRVFARMRRQLAPHQGEERQTWLQVILLGDVALAGVPAEYFTSLGLDIKARSPFKYTYVAELANDWIGYLPDRDGHALGGYQTWMGLHSFAEEGTGERVADEIIAMLNELAAQPNP
jgi:hypothetical protein